MYILFCLNIGITTVRYLTLSTLQWTLQFTVLEGTEAVCRCEKVQDKCLLTLTTEEAYNICL